MRVPMINLGRLVLLASALVLVAWGCQGPDAFYRGEDADTLHGMGGHIGGEGGKLGEGGSGTGGIVIITGSGGSTIGTGGSIAGTGGKITGTGGSTIGTGGRAMGTGGMVGGMGGKMAGTGGKAAGTGGKIAGTGGMVTGAGGAVTGTGGTTRGTGGATGNTPCAGLCDPSTVVTEFSVGGDAGASYQPQGGANTATEACFETTSAIGHANCSNVTGRTLIINGGTAHASGMMPDTCANFVLPAPVNGGFCFQFTAGTPNYASFSAYF